jgi:predicted dehydrogenase
VTGNKEIVRVGQLGLGAWGRNHFRTFAAHPGSKLVSAADPDERSRAVASALAPDVPIHDDPRVVLEDETIEAIIIATPPQAHTEQAKAALSADKDVFVEKPIALSADDAESLVKLADERGRILMVGHILLYHPVVHKLKDYVDEGRLGDMFYMYAARTNLGKVRQVENALWSFAPHDISVMCHLAGSYPTSVTAVGRAYLQRDIAVEDVSFMTLDFDGGVLGHVHVSWLDPHKVRKLVVVGSQQMAVFDDSGGAEKLWLYDKGVDVPPDYRTYGEYLSLRTGDIVIPRVPAGEPLRLEAEAFLEAVKTRVPPLADGRNGLEVLRVLEAASKSLGSGGTPVTV